ncbi:MAG: trehalose-phosphatase [Saprospiraceae bacterium]
MAIFDIVEKFKSARNRLVFLDYDGTLVNLAQTPDKAIPTPILLDALNNLSQQAHTKVIVITGRTKKDIENFLGNIELEIIAEHGAAMKKNNNWICKIDDQSIWKAEVIELFNSITILLPGTFVEEKSSTVAWHYRSLEKDLEQKEELLQKLELLLIKYQLKVLDGNKVLEVMSKETGKGIAVRQIVSQNSYDFILAIGDDVTDEEMFQELKNYENAYTIKVGEGETLAKQKLSSPLEVLKLFNLFLS